MIRRRPRAYPASPAGGHVTRGAGTRPGIPALVLSIPDRVSVYCGPNAPSQLLDGRGLVTLPSFGE